MIRIVTLAAVAAFIALPASAQSIRVSTTGKSADQVKMEVTKAAHNLCMFESQGSSFPVDELRACVKNTVNKTLAQSSDPAIKLAAR
jgi:hypothetical protein